MPDDKAKPKNVCFIVKKPDSKAKRRTFQIVPYTRDHNGKRHYESPVDNDALKSLNHRYLTKEIGFDEANVLIKSTVLPALRKKSKVPERLAIQTMISEENFKVFRDFWRDVYRRKKMDRPKTAEYQLRKALSILGTLSLISSDIDDIQDHWDTKLKGTPHKRYGGRINQMLKYLKRGVQLNLDSVDKRPPRFVTLDELKVILKRVDDQNLRDLYLSLWGTGCRLGEMFALKLNELRDNDSIYICKQITFECELKLKTKNGISHDTVVLPEAEVKAALKRWLSLEDKIQYRKIATHPLIYASREAFPNNPEKYISPHKLRHSFVRYLTERGVNLDNIRKLIGDTLKTTEETYAGWITSSAEVDNVINILNAANKKARGK